MAATNQVAVDKREVQYLVYGKFTRSSDDIEGVYGHYWMGTEDLLLYVKADNVEKLRKDFRLREYTLYKEAKADADADSSSDSSSTSPTEE